MSADWEPVTDTLDRIRVPGGWLYRTAIYAEMANGRAGALVAMSMCFVPSPGKLRLMDPDGPGWPR